MAMSVNHSAPARLALETTLLAHGVPRDAALPMALTLDDIVRSFGAEPATIGVMRGESRIGMTADDLAAFLEQPHIAKANSANLGALMHQQHTCATTVSATIELAAKAGIRVMATGGVGGVHRGHSLDVSADLLAIARTPIAVVCSGCKTFLDVVATREALETLSVPVIGFRTDAFPAFYLRACDASVDARFDDASDLAAFINIELERTGRGMVIANPIPEAHAIAPNQWSDWIAQAEDRASRDEHQGRDVTPRVLSALHELSGGATLRANIELVKSNVALGAELAVAIGANA